MACNNVTHYFKQCHAAFLETNYDEEMLENGSYPAHLKKRISSEHGHLSNVQALELFANHRPPFMTHLILSHLSKENNSPKLAESLFKPIASTVCIHVASRDEASPVFMIQGNEQVTSRATTLYTKPVQLDLFG
jgi:hypothetical protein